MADPYHIPFDTVVIAGGTHGNERTGVVLVQHWQRNPDEIQGTTFATRTLLSNPEAIRRNIRFVDCDLNRSFLPCDLDNPAVNNYEMKRAREITAWMADRREGRRTFVIDLHTSTACMGTTLITDSNPVNLAIAFAVQKALEGARVYSFPDSDRINSCLRAAAPGGLGIEIGPIPQGILRHDILDMTRSAVARVLATLERYNRGELAPPDLQRTLYRHDRHMAFPASAPDGPPVFIHRDLEGRDYVPLHPGRPIFEDLAGRIWHFDGPEVGYPVFINEAAYYHENIAFSLTRKIPLASLDIF
jgi:succinylglutamate desuccinylase